MGSHNMELAHRCCGDSYSVVATLSTPPAHSLSTSCTTFQHSAVHITLREVSLFKVFGNVENILQNMIGFVDFEDF